MISGITLSLSLIFLKLIILNPFLILPSLYLVTGSCLPMFGAKEGETCYMDSDCESGYVCLEGYSGAMECQEPQPGVGKFGKLEKVIFSYRFSDFKPINS